MLRTNSAGTPTTGCRARTPMARGLWQAPFVLVMLAGVTACSKSEPAEATPAKATPPLEETPENLLSAEALRTRYKPMFGTLPTAVESDENPLTEAKIALGRMLYFDERLSKSQTLSCNSCHALDAYGVDVRGHEGEQAAAGRTSAGHRGQLGDRNSPTVYNAALHVAQFWDGREPTVEAQAKGPILNPLEMAMPDEAAVLIVLKSIPGYRAAFVAAFPDESDPITYDNVGKAIGAFERRLVTPAPFDAFLEGKDNALTREQLAGLQVFVETGCVACHNGPGLGGQAFHPLGLLKPYPTQDPGRFKITQSPSDKGVFKVPSLRNIAKTGPYFHDGSIGTLDEAIQVMATHQTPRGQLPDEERARLHAFLESLTGDLPTGYIQKPELPPSGPNTPRPDPS